MPRHLPNVKKEEKKNPRLGEGSRPRDQNAYEASTRRRKETDLTGCCEGSRATARHEALQGKGGQDTWKQVQRLPETHPRTASPRRGTWRKTSCTQDTGWARCCPGLEPQVLPATLVLSCFRPLEADLESALESK